MDTVELTVHVQDEWQEILIAELGDLGFDVFQQEEEAVKAYVAADQWNAARRDHIARWLHGHSLPGPIEERVIPSQNWNARWEESIQPLAVGAFLIKPTWAETPPEHRDKIVVEIDPKMSFGTGYHASTRLVLRFLPAFVHPGDRVLDAGSGTGILAIAALKLGAGQAIAFDHDPWSQRNAVENLALNGVADQVAFREGTIDVVPEGGFDLILANINRNVLLRLLPAFAHKVTPGGHVILAGLLTSDRSVMLSTTAAQGFEVVQEASEGEWWSVVLTSAGTTT